MKKTVFKKALSIVVSMAMIITCFAAMPAMAATTLTVDGTQETDAANHIYKTIAEAVAAAVDGDTIEIAAGTYSEPLDLSNKTGLTVQGVGADQVIINGNVSGGSICWGEPTTLALDTTTNMDISGVTLSYEGSTGYASTIIGMKSANINIHNCIIKGTTDTDGGLVQLSTSNTGSITFDSNVFEGEAATAFKLQWGSYKADAEGKLIVTNNVIKNGEAFNLTTTQDYDVPTNLDIRNNTMLGTIANASTDSATTSGGAARNNIVAGTIANNIVASITLADRDTASVTNNAYLTAVNAKDTKAVDLTATDVFTDKATGDYSVTKDSTVVGAAESTLVPAKDFAGTTRANNTIGAYEGEKTPVEPKDYIVDGSLDASSGNSFKTLAELPTLAAGDTVTFKAGEYTGAINIDGITSTDAKPIVIKGEGGVIITNNAPALVVKDSTNVEVSGLTLRTTVDHETESYIVGFNNANKVSFYDCTLDTNAYFGVRIDGINNSKIYNNSFACDRDFYWQGAGSENNEVYNNLFTGWRGIYSWSGVVKNSKIVNNTFDCDGIVFDTGAAALFEGNTVKNNYFATVPTFGLATSDKSTWDYNAYKTATKYANEGEHGIVSVENAFQEGTYVPVKDGALVGAADATVVPTVDITGATRANNTIGAYEGEKTAEAFTLDKTSYTVGDSIVIAYKGSETAKDYFAIMPKDAEQNSKSLKWVYVANTGDGTVTIDKATAGTAADDSSMAGVDLAAGDYDIYFFKNDTSDQYYAKKTFTVAAAAAKLTAAFVKAGATGGDGTAEKPFATIAEAVAAVGANATITVDDGTYKENVVMADLNGLTIKAKDGTAPVIEGTVSATNCANLTMNSLNITAGADKDAVTITDCANAMITNNEIKDSKTGVKVVATTKYEASVISNKIKNCVTAIDNSKVKLLAQTNVIYGGTTGINVAKTYANANDFANTGELDAYQNTFYNVSGASIVADQPSDIDDVGGTSFTIMNNIFARSENGKGVYVSLATKSHGFWMEHNVYAAAATDKVVNAYGSDETLADCQGNSDDTSSKAGDPGFNNAANSDFTLKADSIAVNIGKSMDMPAKDIMGNAYNADAQDAGAYAKGATDTESAFLSGKASHEATNYVIDPDTTESATNFKTIAAFTAAVTLGSGDTVTIKGGKTYTDALVISDVDASAGDPVVIKTDGEKATIDNGAKEVLKLANCKNFDVSGLDLQASPVASTWGEYAVVLQNCSNIKFHDCNVASKTSAYFGLETLGLKDSEIYNVMFSGNERDLTLRSGAKNVKIYNCVLPGWTGILSWDGPTLEGGEANPNTPTNISIINNTITGDVPVDASMNAGTIIKNNYLHLLDDNKINGATIEYNAYYIKPEKDTSEHSIDEVDQKVVFEDGTYVPKADSVLVGAADSTVMPAFDLAGKTRTTADIGAYRAAKVAHSYILDASLEASSGNSYKTLAEVPALADGDTLTIKAGEYTGTLDIEGDGTNTDGITIKGEGAVNITGPDAGIPVKVIKMNNVDISNITITANGSEATGFWTETSKGLKLHDCTLTGGDYGSKFVDITDSDVYNNKFIGSGRGMYFQGTEDNFNFYNNTMNNYWPLYTWSGTWQNSKIVNNTITGVNLAFYPQGGASKITSCTIENNYFDFSGAFVYGDGKMEGNTIDYNAYSGDKDALEGTHGISVAMADAFTTDTLIPVKDGALIGAADKSVMPTFDITNATRATADIGAYAYTEVTPPPATLTDFDLSNKTIEENKAAGTVVGAFAETNPVTGTTYTYALAGTGNDNASFEISGKDLKTTASFDYETKASYTIGVTISDGTTTSAVKNITITVTDVDETPTALPTFALSNSTISENNSKGATIGTFTANNPVTGTTYTFALAGTNNDNASFVIENNQLKANVAFDYETKASYKVQVTISDGKTTGTPVDFTITIKDVNENSSSGGGSSSGGSTSDNTTTDDTTTTTKHSTGWGGTVTYEPIEDTNVISDMANHWAKSYLQAALDKGILSGYTDNTIRPDNKASRAEVATMIVRLLGYSGSATEDYSDVNSEAWYAEAVSVAAAKGLMSGYGNGTFKPNATITREEAMVVIYNVLQALNANLEGNNTSLSNFSDGANVSSWAKEAVSALVAAKIVSGSNGKLNPKANITRAELAVLLVKVANEYMAN